MFTPNSKMMQVEYIVNSDDSVGEILCCWSPTLNCDVWLPCENILEEYDLEITTEKPKPYNGGSVLKQSWAIIRAKNGDKNQVFWTSADQFEIDQDTELKFIDNSGLDIDVDTISFDYDEVLYSDELDGEDLTWNIGVIEDRSEGKVTLYSAVESNEATGEDEDGESEFVQIPQAKIEAIRQLFIQAGFKVKMKRYPRDAR